MDSCGIEHGDFAVFLPDQKADLRASQDNAFGPSANEMPHDVNILPLGFQPGLAKAQFIVDHIMDSLTFLFVRDDDVQTMFFDKSTAVEVVLHCELRTQQTDLVDPLSLNSLGSGVCDVQQRYPQVILDFIGRFVHGIGAEQKEVGAAILDVPSGFDHFFRGFRPLSLMLEWFDFSEIDGVHEALGRMEAAKSSLHGFIDEPVVFDGGLPTHPAD